MNQNHWIWTSDWHVVSDDADTGGTGETFPTDALAVARHIRSLDPAGVIDLGDCKDHYGAGQSDELENYRNLVMSKMPYGIVNSGVGALLPILPGNHDEVYDYSDPGSPTDFGYFDNAFWTSPYHWACDWIAPSIRFIGIHAYILHDPDANAGKFKIDASELTWLSSELSALPVGYKAIVCSHPPGNDAAFGNGISLTDGGSDLLTILAANSSKIAAYFNGHRHANANTATLNGVLHINGPSIAYTAGNSTGGFILIKYASGPNTLTLHYRYGPPSQYGAFNPTTYTPIVINL